MKSILLGHAGAEKIKLDLDVLLRTRLLVQANSGGGKSWLLRRLAEQLFGVVPVILIDPEGEFATLRERYGYVLVGKGGETPADPRSAELVAQKLLELHAAAVCDLYEMKPAQRHQWVRLFLEALIDAPKKLWQPLVVIVDEAHLFVPEKGGGESEASDAMVGLSTRGRKRGFCPVWATQRLAKVRKDAAAELQNVLIGSTFIDVDRERAAESLGIARADKAAFFDQIKVLPEGNFFAFGRAIALERVLVKIGPVTTTHPEPGSAKHAAEPPPAPEKVRALLPKLGDLPAEAEQRQRTVAELKAENAQLKRDLVVAKKAVPPPAAAPKEKRVEVPVVKDAHVKRMEALVGRLERAQQQGKDTTAEVVKAAADLRGLVATARYGPPPAPLSSPRMAAVRAQQTGKPAAEILRRPTAVMVSRSTEGSGSITLGKCERSVLAVLAQHPDGCSKGKLTLLAGYRWTGTFSNALGALRTAGYLEGPNTGVMRVTEAGLDAIAGQYEPLPTGRALIDYWLEHPSLGLAERKALRALVDAHPDGLMRDELTARTGYQWTGTFSNALGALRTAGLVVGRNTETMRAAEELFG